MAGLLAQHDGLLLARDHRRRKSSLSRWCRAGRIARILPGVYVAPAALSDPDTKLRAALARIPDGVVAGSAAARLTHWPDEVVNEVMVLVSSRRVPHPGYRFVQRRIDPTQRCYRAGMAVLTPAAIAVDASAHDQGAKIDDLLRSGYPLTRITNALRASPGRIGNPTRRRVVRRSRTLPWSQAERRLHDLLDRHRISGWQANRLVEVAGHSYFLDVAWDEARLAIEVDGYRFHSSRQAFEADRHRANDLAQGGWRILRFTWEMLAHEEQIVTWIRSMIGPAKHQRRNRGRRRLGPAPPT